VGVQRVHPPASIREFRRIKGIRFFPLVGILAFIEQCKIRVDSDLNDIGK
jgi:hypothetical protein